MKYVELKEKQSKELEDFPMFFAFNDEQFEEGLKKLNTTKEEIYSLGLGGFIRKTDSKKFSELLKKYQHEFQKNLKDEKFLYEALLYELKNYEYCITYDYTDTLNFLGLDIKKFDDNQMKILHEATEEVLKESD